ncbi:hypothetical protein StoSoilA2_15850 [Arthrobacter sp. StoSoilA2]|nr:hypothetical protein StoSoilA2_15850 [Arthrobacter sp. StoSoilA2]
MMANAPVVPVPQQVQADPVPQQAAVVPVRVLRAPVHPVPVVLRVRLVAPVETGLLRA